MLNTLKKIIRTPYIFYAFILLLGLAAYGLRITELGFYWDDWPWIWSLHINGAQGMLKIDEYHRPLSGVVLYLGGLFAGENPTLWQIYTLVLRISGAAALAFMLNALWRKEKQQVAWIVLLFLLYPGFSQQFVSVNNSRHLFPLITFFLSFGFTIKSLHSEKNARLQTIIALALSIVTMLTSEYYYGLELTRPVLIWLLVRREEKALRPSLLRTFKAWLPYTLLLITLFGWRYSVSTRRNYSITIFDRLNLELLTGAAYDLWDSTFGAWLNIFDLSILSEYGQRTQFLFWGFVVASGIGTLIYLGLQERTITDRSWTRETLLFGGIALVIGLLPFWLTDLDPKLGFPEDRLLLPSALGASILLVVLINLLKPHAAKLLLLAVLVGGAVGHHNQNALVYRSAWASTSSFFQQLSTRAPSLPANTTLLSNQLPGRSTDNSLIAPLNWMYAPHFTDGSIPFQILYVDLRFGRENPEIDESLFTYKPYMRYVFEGSLENTLVVFYEPPACLQLVDPQNPLRKIPAPVGEVTELSNTQLVLTNNGLSAELPAFFAEQNLNVWCDYFQKADLARQQGDWETVAELGDLAFGAGKSPNHPSERIPFIEGYARSDEWEKAVKLTLDSSRQGGIFCEAWTRIKANTEPSQQRDDALDTIKNALECVFE